MRNSGACCTKNNSDVCFCTLGLAVGRECGAERRPVFEEMGFADCGFLAARGLAV